jgi:hypothetical protein
MEYRTTMERLSPSTINVRMSAIRKLVGEAIRNGMRGGEGTESARAPRRLHPDCEDCAPQLTPDIPISSNRKMSPGMLRPMRKCQSDIE